MGKENPPGVKNIDVIDADDREKNNDISPEMEAVFKDAIGVASTLDSLKDPSARDAVIARFLKRHTTQKGMAFIILDTIRGNENNEGGGEIDNGEKREGKEVRKEDDREKLKKCKQILFLVNDLRSTISGKTMEEMIDVFKEKNKGFDIDVIETIVEGSKNDQGEHDVRYILRQLTELQEALIETIDQLEAQIQTDEENDLFDDFDFDGKRKKKERNIPKKQKGKLIANDKEGRKEARKTEFITQFVAMFRQLKAENIKDVFSFREKLHKMFINPNVGTNKEGFPRTRSLYDFVIDYGDNNQGKEDRLKSLFETFQGKKGEFDPYTFARHMLLYEGGGSYTDFVETDPMGTHNNLQVFVK